MLLQRGSKPMATIWWCDVNHRGNVARVSWCFKARHGGHASLQLGIWNLGLIRKDFCTQDSCPDVLARGVW
jgi:hypothetical protein